MLQKNREGLVCKEEKQRINGELIELIKIEKGALDPKKWKRNELKQLKEIRDEEKRKNTQGSYTVSKLKQFRGASNKDLLDMWAKFRENLSVKIKEKQAELNKIKKEVSQAKISSPL